MLRVADFIVNFVKEKGVEHIFMLSGGGAMFLNDAVASNPSIKYICMHHEQCAAMAAESYSRYTNNFGVVMVTAGPGSTNTITGVTGAWIDSVPMLVVSGQSKRSQTVYNSGLPGLRQMGAQEVNIIPIIKHITKYCAMVNVPEKIRYHLEKAYYIAKTGRPGPVWLDIPLDVQSALIDETKLEGFKPNEQKEYFDETKTDSCIFSIKEQKINIEAKISKVIDLIKKSKRPIIVAGNGIRLSHSEETFLKLVRQLDIPVVTTRLSGDIIPYNDTYFVGKVGVRGDRPGNLAMQNSDLLISLGCRLCIPVTGYDYSLFAREAKVIMVDMDDNELNKNTVRIDYPIKYELNSFISLLLSKIANEDKITHNDWVEKCNHWKEKYPSAIESYWNEKGYVNTYCLVDKLSEKLDEGDVIVTDAGTVIDIVNQAFKVKKNQRLILSGGLATMGYALPASIGASIKNKHRTICITGDGSFQMNIQELATVSYNKLPVKIFVINNNGYLAIRKSQNNYFNGRLIGESPKSGIGFPDFEKIAEAYGISYTKINNNDKINSTLDKVLNLDKPVLCEVMNDENRQFVAPRQSSMTLSDGRIVSKPLEDMYPFLDRDEFRKEMIVKPLEE